MSEILIRSTGFIPLVGGAYLLLFVYRKFPSNKNENEEVKKWRQRYGGLVKVVSPLMILYGALRIFGIL